MIQTRDHGGNLDAAIARFGGGASDWLDLSTGINPDPYPLPEISADSWTVLPRKTDMARLCRAAVLAYGTTARVFPSNGATGVIQMVPWLRAAGHARVLTPTYNEHAAALRSAGWAVEEVGTLAKLAGTDIAVVVNPNNPDGQSWQPEALSAIARDVGVLVVDESFVDTQDGLSSTDAHPENMIILRSFGKYYGLAGLRLGFALAHGALADALEEMSGPWPVSGPAIEIAIRAFEDRDWQKQANARLRAGAARLDRAARASGWRLVGGTPLFRTYATRDARRAQEALAARHIWTRIFPYSDEWIRLGLPAQDRWGQLEEAFASLDPSARG